MFNMFSKFKDMFIEHSNKIYLQKMKQQNQDTDNSETAILLTVDLGIGLIVIILGSIYNSVVLQAAGVLYTLTMTAIRLWQVYKK